jgi:RNA polymerase sigma-70 factor, ECF subfamily
MRHAPGADFSGAEAHSSPPSFAYLYRIWFGRVVGWLAILGAPRADIEDLAQEVFLVVRRRLEDFDGRNAAGWLYRIASGQLRQHRRRFLFRALFSGLDPVELDKLPNDRPSALADMETRRKQQLLERLLSRMSEKRRAVFLLCELQGYSGPESSRILRVPVNTIKTRLHHARKDFAKILAAHTAAFDSDP